MHKYEHNFNESRFEVNTILCNFCLLMLQTGSRWRENPIADGQERCAFVGPG